jgi:ligand-binding sensor domain-containing protein
MGRKFGKRTEPDLILQQAYLRIISIIPMMKVALVTILVTAILRDNNGNLWIGTHGGLDRFDEKTNSFIHYRHDPDNPNSLSIIKSE